MCFTSLLFFLTFTHTVGLVARFGKQSWIPWCISIATEVFSLLLNESCGNALRPAERNELKRRWLLLSVFLLWPPFFDSVFRSKAGVACYNAVDKIPFVRKVQSLFSFFRFSALLMVHVIFVHLFVFHCQQKWSASSCKRTGVITLTFHCSEFEKRIGKWGQKDYRCSDVVKMGKDTLFGNQ